MSIPVKICGLTRESDARTAIDLGASALGFVFYAKSKRAVTVEQLPWLKRLPPFVSLVGLFVNPEADFVRAVTDALPLTLLQFHGNESPAFCTQFHQRYLKAVPMQVLDAANAADYMRGHSDAAGFLLDNYGGSEMGGSGTAFNWRNIPDATLGGEVKPLILAGGLHSDNVGQVIAQARPDGVDVSSGVEDAPGVKSAEKMADFMAAVRAASVLA